jgi:hypothetical protein
MTSISNVDRLALIIRQRLKERAELAAQGSITPTKSKKSGLDHIQALAAIDGADPKQIKRALIEQILAQEFGGDLVNDASFQQITQRVLDALEQTEETRRLSDAALEDLRGRS